MATVFGFLFIAVFLTAIVLWSKARQWRAVTGLPFNARIVYADTGAWAKVEKPMFARRYALTGKPDYIVEDAGVTIPIEVKPNRTAPAPRESDVMQLAAYGLLIEEAYGMFPPHGLLKYRDAVFQIDFTDELRAQVLTLIDEMRRDLSALDVARSHSEAPRCRACGYRAECGQVLESF
jgi:CRISPR-associated exonuclease Cas4